MTTDPTDLIARAEASDKRLHFAEVRQDTVRWEPYKPDGRRQMKARGRWQRMEGSGDFWRWTNCDRPNDLHHEDYDYRDALAAALARAEAMEAERDKANAEWADAQQAAQYNAEYVDLALEMRARVVAMEAENARLRDALEPLAALAVDRVSDAPEWQDRDTVACTMTISDLRRARAALTGEAQP